MLAATRARAAYGVAAVVAAVGAALHVTAVQRGSEAVAMLALATCTAVAGQTAPRLRRRILMVFCLLLAASALAKFAAGLMPFPGLLPVVPNGCPTQTDPITSYWRGQLRYGQLAEILRFVALACAIQAVRLLPRPPRPRSWRERAVTALLPIPVFLFGLTPFSSTSNAQSLLSATAPAVLTLTAGTCLTALTTTRTSGRPTENAALISGAILTMISTVQAVGTLAGLDLQLPEPEPANAFGACLSSIVEASTPSLPQTAGTFAGALLLLAAPAVKSPGVVFRG